VILSPTPFFTPTPAFLSWMADHYGEDPIIDAGCGYGNFVEDMLLNGCSGAFGLDLVPEKLDQALTRHPHAVARLLLGDTRNHEIMNVPNAVIVFARPCHDASWICDTYEHAKKSAKTFLYISKPGNEVDDLEGFERRQVAWDIEVGQEGEIAWEFRKIPEDCGRSMADWCLIDFHEGTGEHGTTKRVWVRDGRPGGVWYWGWGPSYTTCNGEDVIAKARIADDWLNWSATTTYQHWAKRVDDETLDNGWVSPEGRLYRCSYWEHDSLVYGYLCRLPELDGIDKRQLEKAGWCKLQRASPGERHLFVMGFDRKMNDLPMTKEQVATLVKAGFTPPTYMLEEAEGDWSELIAKLDDGEFGGIDLNTPNTLS